MANFPCDNTIICPCTDNPLGNFSSEAPDPFVYYGFRPVLWNPNNPIGGHRPPAPPIYYAADCAGFCTSTLSQEDADLCAARQAFICSHTPPGGGPPQLFFNQPQSCSLPCGNGSFFVWQVPGGAFVNVSQAAADNQAQAYACQQAALHAFCLNDIPNEAETGTEYDATIFVNGAARTPVHFLLVAGSLPPGLTLTPEGPLSTFLHGTPTTTGTFTFTIEAVDAIGVFVTKQYTITVTSTCSQFWTSIAGNWTFQFQGANSTGSISGNLLIVSAYTKNGIDLFGITIANNGVSPPLNPVLTAQFQCTLTVVPLVITNIGPIGVLQIQIDDANTAAVYFTFTGAPGAPTVFNFTLPVGAKPRVSATVTLQSPVNGFDSQLAYGITLG